MIMGWIILVLGLIALVMGAYAQVGYWICLLLAVFWYISLHQAGLRIKKKKELITRLKEMPGPVQPLPHPPNTASIS
jgi:hypothetical protein